MELGDHIAVLAGTHPQLAKEIAGFHGLEKVIGWLKDRSLSLSSLEMVTQDEFSHDLLIPLGTGEYLVFGMT
jgi:hypothetical protein